MLKLSFPQPVKFICGFIYCQEKSYQLAKDKLAKKFKTIDYHSEKIRFDYTSYYCQEMGSPLWRNFISFNKLKSPSELVKFKHFCLKLEKKFKKNNSRTVNIDPGYLSQSKIVLATTKDFSHRIYLSKGIYAETTLFYQKNQYQHFNTTFPDYRTILYKDIFQQIRNIYLSQTQKTKK